MEVTFLGTRSDTGNCPTVCETDRGTYLVQGAKVADEEALAEFRKRGKGIPEHETVVESPKELVSYFPTSA
jgi:hypothetical protein